MSGHSDAPQEPTNDLREQIAQFLSPFFKEYLPWREVLYGELEANIDALLARRQNELIDLIRKELVSKSLVAGIPVYSQQGVEFHEKINAIPLDEVTALLTKLKGRG